MRRMCPKSIISILLTIAMAFTIILAVPADSVNADGGTAVKSFNYSMNPGLGSITVKWSKKEVSYYLIYRTEFKVNNYYDIDSVPLSKYRRVKKLSGNRTSWKDNSVINGHYYDYVIKGFIKSGKKTKLVCSSYRSGATNYQCPGLQKPDLINAGYGEDYANSKNCLYLFVQRSDGVRPDGVEIYRRSLSESEYKKINVTKAEKGSFDCGKTYKDTSVKPGKTYYYKARTWVRKNGTKKYSPYSDTLKLSAVNFTGKYKAKAINAAGSVNDFTVKLVSDKYNGILKLKGDGGDESIVYMTKAGGKDYGSQEVILKSYSKDNKHWHKIPSKDLIIKPGQKVYLKFIFRSGSGYFSSGSGNYSIIDFMYGNASYMDSFGGATFMNIDLKKGKASAFPDYDN